MPVERLPAPSWQNALGLGFVSAIFDNIPLTALALKQGGYDWGMLAYAVGFGGSMIWFGSSAGVAISDMYPEARRPGVAARRLADRRRLCRGIRGAAGGARVESGRLGAARTDRADEAVDRFARIGLRAADMPPRAFEPVAFEHL